MRLYLDTSALVKCYMTERSSQDVLDLAVGAELVGTSLISRAEVAAAFARAVRLGGVRVENGRRAQGDFLRDWTDLTRIPVTEALLSRADTLA
jgi:predicted nucleic acid-binding protein